MKKPIPPTGNRRPTATIDLKAEEVKKDQPDTADTTEPTATGDRITTPVDKDARTGEPAAAGEAAKPGPGAAAGAKPGSAAGDPSAATAAGAAAKPTAPRPEPSKTESAGPKPATPAAPRGNGSPIGAFLTHLATAVMGAAIGILGISFANNQHLLPDDFDLSGGGAYREQIIALEDKISALDARSSNTGLDSLGGQLVALRERLAKIEAALGTSGDESPLADKVAALAATIGNLEAAAKTGEGGELAGLTAVTKELTRANDQASRLNGEFIKMRDEQSAFREDLAALRSGQADFHIVAARLADQIARLQEGAAKLTADMSRPPDISAQIDPVNDAVKTLRNDVDGLMDRESGSRAEGRNIALALSLGELKRAVNQGVPYRAELNRVSPHAPRNLDLTALMTHAETGLVTLEALRDQLTPLTNNALAAETTAVSGSLVDRLVANAKSLVQVRPSGLVEGDTTAARLARLEYRFDRNDLAGALQEGAQLTGEARKVVQPWLERAGARLEADRLLITLEDRIRNSLAGVGAQ